MNEYVQAILDQLVGKTIVEAAHYVDNGGVGGEGTTLILDDGTRVDLGVDYDGTGYYVREVDNED